jgi:transposase InsO family protein
MEDAATVMEQLPYGFEDYNDNHPYKGLNMRSPREYRRRKYVRTVSGLIGATP